MKQSRSQTQWPANDMFTLADINIMPSVVRLEDLGLTYLWADLPHIIDWCARLQQRPAFATHIVPHARAWSELLSPN